MLRNFLEEIHQYLTGVTTKIELASGVNKSGGDISQISNDVITLKTKTSKISNNQWMKQKAVLTQI